MDETWTHNCKISFRTHTSHICHTTILESSHSILVSSPSILPRHNWEQHHTIMRSPLFIPLLKYCSNELCHFSLLCLNDSLSLFTLSLAPKVPLGEVTQEQMITEWYEYEKLKLISRDKLEQQMSNTFFLWETFGPVEIASHLQFRYRKGGCLREIFRLE